MLGGGFVRNCRALFNSGHVVIIVTSIIGWVISAAGVYGVLKSDISETRRAHEDLVKTFDAFIADTHRWQADERDYDKEIRARLAESEKEARSTSDRLGEMIGALRSQGKMMPP
jgi:hypothetical protein